MTSALRNVSDTALWVAMCRAIESERPDALFCDPYARLLAGGRGETIIGDLPQGRAMAWPVVARTAVMDEIILQRVAAGARSVLNLGAGLDARAYRLPLPAALRWVDVDLPELIALRRERLAQAPPACEHASLAADLSDAGARAAALAQADGGAPALAITEGLLAYLSEQQVSALALQLHAQPALRWWLTDLMSPQLLRMLKQSWDPMLSAANASMQFAPADGAAFFAALGWRLVEQRSVWDEAIRLGRAQAGAPAQMQQVYRRMSLVVLLERVEGNPDGAVDVL
ncbi:methyltransferase (TIGR00027 family) [Oxalobacteraceae bacterium GrIS 1.11]